MALRFLHPPRFFPLGGHGANTLQRHDALPTQGKLSVSCTPCILLPKRPLRQALLPMYNTYTHAQEVKSHLSLPTCSCRCQSAGCEKNTKK